MNLYEKSSPYPTTNMSGMVIPVSWRAIVQKQTHMHNSVTPINSEDGIRACIICFDSYSKDEFYFFPCFHSVCNHCAGAILRQSQPLCPECRYPVALQNGVSEDLDVCNVCRRRHLLHSGSDNTCVHVRRNYNNIGTNHPPAGLVWPGSTCPVCRIDRVLEGRSVCNRCREVQVRGVDALIEREAAVATTRVDTEQTLPPQQAVLPAQVAVQAPARQNGCFGALFTSCLDP